jgi:hypothetical protein
MCSMRMSLGNVEICYTLFACKNDVNLDTGAGNAGLRERSIPVQKFSLAQ